MNEVLIPTQLKDRWNAARAGSGGAVRALLPRRRSSRPPQPALPVPRRVQGDRAATTSSQVLLTGVPNLNNTGTKLADMLRLNLSIPADRPRGRNRLGVLARRQLQGWPNGRRLEDDVIDIAERAVAGALLIGKASPLGDGVDANDVRTSRRSRTRPTRGRLRQHARAHLPAAVTRGAGAGPNRIRPRANQPRPARGGERRTAMQVVSNGGPLEVALAAPLGHRCSVVLAAITRPAARCGTGVEPPRGAAHQRRPGGGQHGRLRVREPGPARHGHARGQLHPARGAGRRAELREVRRRRPLRAQGRQRRRRRGRRHLRVPLQDADPEPGHVPLQHRPDHTLGEPGLEHPADLHRDAGRQRGAGGRRARRRTCRRRRSTSAPARRRTTTRSPAAAVHRAARRRSRSSPASATIRSSSTSARCSTSPACARSTRPT